MNLQKKYLVIIAGPTAVGKTALSIQLAQQFDSCILSCDSRQLYKEMCIGTAKPTQEEMKGIPHYFIDHLSIFDNYNVGAYEKEVITLLDNLFEKHSIVFLVGGTGLYIDAVCHGIDVFEDIPSEVRESIVTNYQIKGINWLQEQIQTHDPNYYSTADIHNPQRLIRALEVCIHTQKPYSSFRKKEIVERPFDCIPILINEDRPILYERINSRVDNMIQNGLIEEATQLYPHKHLNALNTVGYKEVFDYIEGKQDLSKTIELIKQNTRRYAKRQLTWFRHHNNYEIFLPSEVEKIIAYIDIIQTNS